MARKTEKPLDKIIRVRSTLDLYAEFGEGALLNQTLPEFLAEVRECYGHLMAFRNMVNSMARLDETPQEAVLQYMPMSGE